VHTEQCGALLTEPDELLHPTGKKPDVLTSMGKATEMKHREWERA
jgi:hypothetical protein